MDFSESDKVREVRTLVREFVEREALPLEGALLRDGFPALLPVLKLKRERARQTGLWAAHVPERFGGAGLSLLEFAHMSEELGRSPVGHYLFNVQAPDVGNMELLIEHGTPEQQERFLLPLVRGDVRSCFTMTEPEFAGSNPVFLGTTARRDGDSWVLDGHKWFASGAVDAAFAIVVARAPEGVCWFLVDTANPGWELVRNIRSMDGFSHGGHGEIRLNGCRVAADALIGEVGKGFDYAQLRLEGARLFHCMRGTGLAARAMEIAQAYVTRRESFGAPLVDHQLVQAMAADAHIDLYAARLMTSDVARRLDEGESIRHYGSMAKVFVSEALNRIVDRAAQMTGALGMSEDTPISMIVRKLRPFRIYDGASEVHRSAIGKRIFQKGVQP